MHSRINALLKVLGNDAGWTTRAFLHFSYILQVPNHSFSDVPNHSLSDVPDHSLSDVPNHSLSDVPNHSLSDVPNHSLSDEHPRITHPSMRHVNSASSPCGTRATHASRRHARAQRMELPRPRSGHGSSHLCASHSCRNCLPVDPRSPSWSSTLGERLAADPLGYVCVGFFCCFVDWLRVRTHVWYERDDVSSNKVVIHTRVISDKVFIHTRVINNKVDIHTRVISDKVFIHTRVINNKVFIHTRVISDKVFIHTRVLIPDALTGQLFPLLCPYLLQLTYSYMYMYVYIYIHTHTYIYIYIHTYIYIIQESSLEPCKYQLFWLSGTLSGRRKRI